MRRAPSHRDLPAEARRLVGSADPVYAPFATAIWRIPRPRGAALYLKAGWVGAYPSLAGEGDRCRWLSGQGAPVPEVLDYGAAREVEWLLTTALPGVPATAAEHLAAPRRTVPILAEGLRAFHDIHPTGCPFDHRLETTLRHVSERVDRGEVDLDDFHEEHRHLTPGEAMARLRSMVPQGEDLVVSHGDYCFPNVMIEEGRAVGFLDLGEAGLADRWRDLAVATWSVTWNVGPGYEDLFLQAYGIDWDPDRRDYYRLLYDLES